MNKDTLLNIKPLGFPWETMDPFIFCAYHHDKFPKGNAVLGPDASLSGRNIGQDFRIKDGWRMYHGEKVPGFPYHPHRGFETITVVEQGFVDHFDSLGTSGRYGKGDVQWMTAGKGVLHAEMFPLVYQEKENPTELFQIWLNLPKAKKMAEPHYKMLWSEDIPRIHQTDENGKRTEIKLIAGTLNGTRALEPTPESWATNPENEVLVLTIKIESGGSYTLPAASKNANRMLYFYRGSGLSISGEVIPENHSVQAEADREITMTAGSEDCFLLVLQGKPLHEPVVQYGPFVMNSEAEIRQAFMDYQRTQFGGWPWPENEPVHGRDKGRFAIYADGSKDIK